jgi:predicted N-acyltransferase
MIKEFENVTIGGIDYDYIAIDTKNILVEKTYIIKNKHKYEWKFSGTNQFGDWDSFINILNGKEYTSRVYSRDVITFVKELKNK